MSNFAMKGGELYAEDLKVSDLAAEYGTPLYVYSRSGIEETVKSYVDAIKSPHLVCYAVKANGSLAVLSAAAKAGSGFDIVSGGELARVIAAGGDPHKVVYSGVGKREDEIEFALEQGIFCFNVESPSEMRRISEIATRMGKVAPVSYRVNPNVDAHTHPYISTGLKKNKFGIAAGTVVERYLEASKLPGIEIKGIDCHIGSQLTEITPFSDAADKIIDLIDQLEKAGIKLSHVDMGGGLGVDYGDGVPPTPQEYMQLLESKFAGRGLTLVVEPGRSIVAKSGILVTKVEYIKHGEISNFAIVDAGMNDMIRPSLYQAVMRIGEVKETGAEKAVYDVVGPICETGDFLGKGRELAISEGDLIAQFDAGAYGFAMSSEYNARPRVCEIIVKGDKAFVARRRGTVAELMTGESVPEA